MNILLTGKPAVGKTTAIKKIIDLLGSENVDGFWTTEILKAGRRTGFAIHTTGRKKGILADTLESSGPRVGKYRVNVGSIDEVAIPALERARTSGKKIIIDEIASMELKSSRFAPEVRKCLDTGRVLGTLQLRKGEFQDEVRSRTDVRLIEVTPENRDHLPAQVFKYL
ncbi:MAG: NTPase [Candidatus Thorarchaeota archaeon]|jgi:nucleoside-triphosphatase